jgi:hypothetical protein
MRFRRDWLGGREMPTVLAVVCSILCAAPQPAWAAPAATATALAFTSAGNAVTTVTSGALVTLTATVTAGSTAVAPGQINFCDATAKYLCWHKGQRRQRIDGRSAHGNRGTPDNLDHRCERQPR